MYTEEFYNGKRIEIQNILVTNLNKLNTYERVELEGRISGAVCVYVNPETYNYGLDGDKYSAMDAYFYSYNKALLLAGISVEQIKEIDSEVGTRLNKSFRAGQIDGAKWERRCQNDKNLVSYI